MKIVYLCSSTRSLSVSLLCKYSNNIILIYMNFLDNGKSFGFKLLQKRGTPQLLQLHTQSLNYTVFKINDQYTK